MFFRTVPQAVWDVCMLGTAGVSVWRGGWAERTVAFGMIADSVGSAIFQNIHDFSAPPWGILAVDAAYLVVLIGVALKSDRWWPLWTAAFQLLEVVVSFAKAADRQVVARAHIAAGEIWSYLILVVVLLACWERIGRQAKLPPTPSRPTGSSAT